MEVIVHIEERNGKIEKRDGEIVIELTFQSTGEIRQVRLTKEQFIKKLLGSRKWFDDIKTADTELILGEWDV